MMYVTTRPGCLRWRTASASAPRTCVGAPRYRTSASAASRRPPPAALRMIAFRSIEKRFARPRQIELAGELVEPAEAGGLALAKSVLHIGPQVVRAPGYFRRIARKIPRGHRFGGCKTAIGRRVQRRDVGG